jgi:hypothetical protein
MAMSKKVAGKAATGKTKTVTAAAGPAKKKPAKKASSEHLRCGGPRFRRISSITTVIGRSKKRVSGGTPLLTGFRASALGPPRL